MSLFNEHEKLAFTIMLVTTECDLSVQLAKYLIRISYKNTKEGLKFT